MSLLDIQDTIPALTVFAGRAGMDTPVPYTSVNQKELQSKAVQTSVPLALEGEPSVVSTNEGGTGLGYSQIRIRGVAGGQTTVSLNGISLNGAEDGEVFWVNIPALGKYLNSIQIQRGLGTAACGPGAFGAGINMRTEDSMESLSAEFNMGSFGTVGGLVQAPLVHVNSGRGVLSASGAYSLQHTDGYIRNGFATVQSALGLVSWDNGKDRIGLTILFGQQHSGITWEGIPAEKYQEDPRYNPAGEYIDKDGNIRYYDNQSDNYRQLHFQLNWKHNFSSRFRSSTTLNYTDGFGYYEQYRAAFLDDGSDAVTKDALDNSLYVLRSDLSWQNESLALSGGVYASCYSCLHYGQAWQPQATGSITPWYSNDALKYEADAYLRAEWYATKRATLYGEIQGRGLHHNMKGPDEYGQDLDFGRTWLFANPRIGITFRPSSLSRIMASAAIGHREPTRADLQASTMVKPETMLDLEASYRISGEHFAASAGVYAMEYFDMLLETGKINDAGYVIKENTPRAFRRGIELSGEWKPAEMFSASANLTLSTNRIRRYTAYLDNYDSDWNFLGQSTEEYDNAPILLSPSAIAGAKFEYRPGWMNQGFCLRAKYVGRQYWDNTGNPDRQVPAYWTAGMTLGHQFQFSKGPSLTVWAEADNLLDRHYYAYAWVWRAIVDGKPYQSEGLYPQAPFNARLGVKIAF